MKNEEYIFCFSVCFFLDQLMYEKYNSMLCTQQVKTGMNIGLIALVLSGIRSKQKKTNQIIGITHP